MIVLMASCSSKTDTTVQKDTAADKTAVAENEETMVAEAGELFLSGVLPVDKSTVVASSVTVSGKTLPVAIVSVNGILVKVQPDGTFSTNVQLELGPNVIQIVASDISGEQVGKVITVGRSE